MALTEHFSRPVIQLPGTDFIRETWPLNVIFVNPILISERYVPFVSEDPKKVLISNARASNPLSPFDPVRVYYNYLGETFSPQEKAVATLGIQYEYWQGLMDGLTSQSRDKFPFHLWRRFSCVPVIVDGDKNFFISSHTAPLGIQLAGDINLVSEARDGVMKVDCTDVRFNDLKISEELTGAYVAHRETLVSHDDIARRNALNHIDYFHKAEFDFLLKAFPRFKAIISEWTDYGEFYLSLAKKLKRIQFGVGDHDVLPGDINTLLEQESLVLATMLHSTTVFDYGEYLRRDPNFINAIKNLAQVSREMYECASRSV